MRISSIALTVRRLGDGLEATALPIFAVMPGTGECIVVNRLYEAIGDNVHALVAVTVFADAVDRMEEIGDLVLSCLKDGDEPWSFGEARDVLFEKLGSDITGFDDRRKQFVRTIEFGVSW